MWTAIYIIFMLSLFFYLFQFGAAGLLLYLFILGLATLVDNAIFG